MFTRADLAHQQVPHPQLWFWNILSTNCRNLQSNVHARLGLTEPVYVVLLKQQSFHPKTFACIKCRKPWLENAVLWVVLEHGARGWGFRRKLFGLRRHNLSWTELLTGITVSTGVQTIHMFLWKRLLELRRSKKAAESFRRAQSETENARVKLPHSA